MPIFTIVQSIRESMTTKYLSLTLSLNIYIYIYIYIYISAVNRLKNVIALITVMD